MGWLKIGSAVAAPLGLWSAWRVFILGPNIIDNLEHDSPLWFRVMVSRWWYKFSKMWMSYTYNVHEMLKSGRLDPSRQAIIVMGPHGQYTVGALCFESHWVAKGWPWEKMNAVVADVLLKLPVVTDYLALVKTKPASETVINGLLKNGSTVCLYPGGIHEQVRTDENQETLYFPNSLSFVRLAINHGVDLVPCYNFGENQLWPTSDNFISANKWLYDKTGVGNVLLHSPLRHLPTSVLLPSPLLMPRFRAPLHCRLGDYVSVGPADPNPSDTKILEVFERYVESLMRLFDEHKDACLPPAVAARGLTIILRGGKKRNEKIWKSGKGNLLSKL